MRDARAAMDVKGEMKKCKGTSGPAGDCRAAGKGDW